MFTDRRHPEGGSIVLLVLMAMAGIGPVFGQSARDALLAAELGAARQPNLYLIVDAQAHQVEIKVRGMTLDRVAFRHLSLLVYHPVGASESVPPPLPIAFTVLAEPVPFPRQVIAPSVLRPLPEDPSKADPPPVGVAFETPPLAPTSYRVELDGGWRLAIGPKSPRVGPLSRLASCLADGWARIRGRDLQRPGLVVLAAEPEEARRLHHLFRQGTRIFLVGSSP